MELSVDDSQLRALQATLESKDGSRLGAEASKATRASINRIKATMKRTAPHRTGALQDNIWSNVFGDGRSTAISAAAGSTLRQGFFQEHGTSKTAAHPWAKPAFDAEEPTYVAALERIVGEALDDL